MFAIATPELIGDVHLTLLALARERGLLPDDPRLLEVAGGTGEVAQAVADGRAAVGVGLTEGLILAITDGLAVRLVGGFVDTPLTWLVLVPGSSPIRAPEQLRGRPIGITRRRSGSHLMVLTLAKAYGWREARDFTVVECGGFRPLLGAAVEGTVAALVWEYWATRPLAVVGELTAISHLFGAGPSFMLTASVAAIERQREEVQATLRGLQEAGAVFRRERAASIDRVAGQYGLSRGDADAWFASVRYSGNGAMSRAWLGKVADALVSIGVLVHPVEAEALVVEGFAPITP